MTELLVATGIIALAGLGLGIGLLFGRGPAQSSCGAAACIGKGACDICPRRKEARE